MSKRRIFIDGEHGTTGILIRELLKEHADLDVVSIAADKRKDRAERQRLLNSVDLAILCLPDDAARESVAMIENPAVRVLDASTAHRVAPGWAFGFPEMDRDQAGAIRASQRVSNPGCWSTCFIALMRPLVEAGLIPPDFPLSVWGVSGYSGGGRQMIEAFESPNGEKSRTAFMAYGLKLAHKHLPEMQHYSGLQHPPLFTPSVGRFRQGMLVQIPISTWALPQRVSAEALHTCLSKHYAGQNQVKVVPMDKISAASELEAETLNDTNLLELMVFGNDATGQAVLVARQDNLGKGAGRAAVQNLRLMLDLGE